MGDDILQWKNVGTDMWGGSSEDSKGCLCVSVFVCVCVCVCVFVRGCVCVFQTVPRAGLERAVSRPVHVQEPRVTE